jgi:restriction system protein
MALDFLQRDVWHESISGAEHWGVAIQHATDARAVADAEHLAESAAYELMTLVRYLVALAEEAADDAADADARQSRELARDTARLASEVAALVTPELVIDDTGARRIVDTVTGATECAIETSYQADRNRGAIRSVVDATHIPAAALLASALKANVSPLLSLTLLLQGVVYEVGKTDEGRLIESVSPAWKMIARLLKDDPKIAFEISPYKWEELVAAAFDEAGYDEVIVTPKSGDRGRDVIAIKNGVGAVRIIGSVKAYGSGRLVRHDDVRALAGVLSTDMRATKGIVVTTSDFAPGIATDPYIRPLLPFRLELMNGVELKRWFEKLASI